MVAVVVVLVLLALRQEYIYSRGHTMCPKSVFFLYIHVAIPYTYFERKVGAEPLYDFSEVLRIWFSLDMHLLQITEKSFLI